MTGRHHYAHPTFLYGAVATLGLHTITLAYAVCLRYVLPMFRFGMRRQKAGGDDGRFEERGIADF